MDSNHKQKLAFSNAKHKIGRCFSMPIKQEYFRKDHLVIAEH